MKRRWFAWLGVGLLAVSVSFAARKPLAPPSLVRFEPAQFFHDDYRVALQVLEVLVEKTDSDGLSREFKGLFETLNQEVLVEALGRMTKLAQTSPEGAQLRHVERQRLQSAIDDVKTVVESGRYVKGYPIEVTVNDQRRRYDVKWKSWDGKKWAGQLRTKVIPFVPRMRITVIGTYDERTDGGKYGYQISNGSSSTADVSKMWVEARGLTEERLRLLRASLGADLTARVTGGVVVRLSLPGASYLQDFRFYAFDLNKQLVRVKPGSSITYPPMLRVPWKQLPGVVACWVDAGDFQDHLWSEADPEILGQVFSEYRIVPTTETGAKKIPVYLYQGRTIGPVPVPDRSVRRDEFLKTILQYLSEAEGWGWIAPGRVADRLRFRLNALSNSGIDAKEVIDMVSDAESAHRRGDLLEEAYVLLRHNLLYLADDVNWRR